MTTTTGECRQGAKGAAKKYKWEPKVIDASVFVPVEDVCLGEESGWREIDQAFVDTLVQEFLAGNYGNNVWTLEQWPWIIGCGFFLLRRL